MKRVWLAAVAAAACLGGAASADTAALVQQARERAAAMRANEPLIRELGAMEAIEQTARERFLSLRKDASEAERAALDAVWEAEYEPFDAANTARLKQLLQGRGWFRRSEVGERAANAAFLIVQHSPDDAFQKAVLAKMEPLLREGDVDGQHYALLYDRIAEGEGRPQRYGTQGTDCEGGEYVVPRNLEDPAGLEARRKAMGLMPMSAYLARLKTMYGACTPPPAVMSGKP